MPRPTAVAYVPPRSPTAPATPPTAQFCQKCGWAIKKIRYIDVRINQIVEKYTCPNRSCQNHNG